MAQMNESWIERTYEWVRPHMNKSWHIWMSHGTCEWVMSRMNESCRIWKSAVTYEWVMFRTFFLRCFAKNPKYRALSTCLTYHSIHMCDMTPSYVWHDSFICETWLLHMWDMTHSYMWLWYVTAFSHTTASSKRRVSKCRIEIYIDFFYISHFISIGLFWHVWHTSASSKCRMSMIR